MVKVFNTTSYAGNLHPFKSLLFISHSFTYSLITYQLFRHFHHIKYSFTIFQWMELLNFIKCSLITEISPSEPIGSCCDNSRFNFKECGNWWYYCEKLNLKNHTVWLKYSSDGFTMPLSTEHQRICSYPSNQIYTHYQVIIVKVK